MPSMHLAQGLKPNIYNLFKYIFQECICYFNCLASINPVCKIAKKNILKECVLVNSGTQNTAPCFQKYTPADCFFADFAHWEVKKHFIRLWKVSTNKYNQSINCPSKRCSLHSSDTYTISLVSYL